jgi:hypothetical protein
MMLPLRLISGDKLYFNILRCFFLKIKFQILAFPGLGQFQEKHGRYGFNSAVQRNILPEMAGEIITGIKTDCLL